MLAPSVKPIFTIDPTVDTIASRPDLVYLFDVACSITTGMNVDTCDVVAGTKKRLPRRDGDRGEEINGVFGV